MAIMAVIVLLAPVLLLTFVESHRARLAVVVLADAVFVAVLSLLARQRAGEVFVAGATYVDCLLALSPWPLAILTSCGTIAMLPCWWFTCRVRITVALDHRLGLMRPTCCTVAYVAAGLGDRPGVLKERPRH